MLHYLGIFALTAEFFGARRLAKEFGENPLQGSIESC